MKTKFKACALVVILLPTILLTGCATDSSAPTSSLQIYQPRTLQLQAGLPIQTQTGIYVPQVNEVWHSPAAYNDLESQLINLAASKAQQNAR